MGIDAIVKTRQTQAFLKKKEPNFQDDAPGKERGPNKSDRTHLLLYYLPVSAVLTRNQQISTTKRISGNSLDCNKSEAHCSSVKPFDR